MAPQTPDPQTWLKGRDPKAFNSALHFVGAVEFYAREIEGWSLDDVLPHLTPDEATELRRHIGRIDAVHGQVATRI